MISASGWIRDLLVCWPPGYSLWSEEFAAVLLAFANGVFLYVNCCAVVLMAFAGRCLCERSVTRKACQLRASSERLSYEGVTPECLTTVSSKSVFQE